MDIHEAVLEGDVNAVRKLLKNGRSVSCLDKSGRTPLHWAIVLKSDEIAQVLVVNTPPRQLKLADRHGRTVLHYAAACGSLELARILLGRGLTVDVRDKSMCTPLHLASKYGHTDVVSLLLDKGADFMSKDAENRTPTDFAAKLQFFDVVDILNKKKPNVIVNKLIPHEVEASSKENLSPNCPTKPATEIGHNSTGKLKKLDLNALLGEWKKEVNKSKKIKEPSKTQKLDEALVSWRKSEEEVRQKTPIHLLSPSSSKETSVSVDRWSMIDLGPLEGDSFKQQSMQSTVILSSNERNALHEANTMRTSSVPYPNPIYSWEDIWSSPPINESPKSFDFKNKKQESLTSVDYIQPRSTPTKATADSTDMVLKTKSSFADSFYISALLSLNSIGEDFHWCTEWESTKKDAEFELQKMEKIAKLWETRMLDRMQNRIHSLNNLSLRVA